MAGFQADPGTSQTEGTLPTLTSRLNALAQTLGDTIYGISGYRTPAQSVAVGGSANDPHTQGIAEDIGVNSQLRSSAAQLSNAQLAEFGLERPFDMAGQDPTEVNHIQEIPGWSGNTVKTTSIAGAGAATFSGPNTLISTPPVSAAQSTPSLSGGADKLLTSDQQEFGSQLAADTGLSPDVIAAWMLAEQSGPAAASYQDKNFNDWLNIGQTGSGDFGNSDSIWTNPVTAANATAQWLKGANSVPGYGIASAGIQSILSSATGTPAQQIAALQGSGWAGSGYPALTADYNEVTGAGSLTAGGAFPAGYNQPTSSSTANSNPGGGSITNPIGYLIDLYDDIKSGIERGLLIAVVVIAGAYLLIHGLSKTLGDNSGGSRMVPVAV